MILRVGYIPYLNMAPFHQGFGPAPIDHGGFRIEFPQGTPRLLGQEAEHGRLDAGALSLVDCFRLSSTFEPLQNFGIGVKGPAQSVLVFSKVPLNHLTRGMCAVTDETSTSLRLFQMIMEEHYGVQGLSYGRIASSSLFDGEAEALLLIGDEALKAKARGVPGFPDVTDLGTVWQHWQGTPFVFARWMVRKSLDPKVKLELQGFLEKSLETTILKTNEVSTKEGFARRWDPYDVVRYWSGFSFRLTPEHEKSIQRFEEWVSAHV